MTLVPIDYARTPSATHLPPARSARHRRCSQLQSPILASALENSTRLRRLRSIIEGIGAIVWEYDPPTQRFTYVSDYAEFVLGYPCEVWYQPDFLEKHLHPADRERVIAVCREESSHDRDQRLEYRMIAADGRVIWMENIFHVETTVGSLSGLSGVLIDVTDRKKSEEALQESDERFRLHFESNPIPIYVWRKREEEFHLVDRNIAADALSKGNVGALLNMPLSTMFADRKDIIADLHACHARRKSISREVRLRMRLTREVKDLLVHYVFVPPDTVMVHVQDFTEQKQAERTARQRESEIAHISRVATAGELASGIAHELNQPLTAITNYAESCRRRLEPISTTTDCIRYDLVQIQSQALRAGQIIHGLRNLVKPGSTSLSAVSLNDIIQETLSLLDSSIRLHEIAIDEQLTFKLPTIEGDSVALMQAVLNLLINAIDAVRDKPAEERKIIVRTRAVHGDRLEVEIADTGCGFTSDKLQIMFKPFYTTKSGHIGFGLTMCRSVAESHGGTITATSDGRNGAAFTLRLPLQRGAAS